ncbi:MAG: hypothetical protein AB8G05_01015 [Oligoflexales bacterium]
MSDAINPEQVKIALSHVQGTIFENFVNAFLPSLMGVNFIPLGGYKDGGSDGIQDMSDTWINSDKPTTFYQASIETNVEGKIKRTIARLKEVGRTPKTLYYLSSQKVSCPDKIEESLSDELEVIVKIKDQEYFASHINHDVGTRGSFNIISHYLKILEKPGNSDFIPTTNNIKNPAIYVFLRQEADARGAKTDLLECMTDSLILWALEDTDPDPDNLKLMNVSEIEEKIKQVFSDTGHWVFSRIQDRLNFLSSKFNESGRKVRHHTKESSYCLPYETRKLITEENQQDKHIVEKVKYSIKERIRLMLPDKFEERQLTEMSKVAIRAIQLTFEREGVSFSNFINNGDESTESYDTIANQIDEALTELGFAKHRLAYKETLLLCFKHVFYSKNPEEQEYFIKLSRTYSLLFSLHLNHDVVRYFEDMASHLNLLVGSDVIVRALAERYVPEADQQTRNLFKILKGAGSTLFLTHATLEKVHNHLISTNHEFNNHFRSIERRVTPEIARNSHKILIRSYFYSKFNVDLGKKRPINWEQYIGQFCAYQYLEKQSGLEDLKAFIINQFGFNFISHQEIDDLISDKEELEKLIVCLKEIKNHADLAKNTARIALAVYGLRDKNKEIAKTHKLGLKTWCLSNETRIYHETKWLTKDKGQPFLLRPEFLLNFISMSPKHHDVRNAFKDIFPSLLGIRLANRVEPNVLHDMLKKIDEAEQYEDGRIDVLISDIVDTLKSDYGKKYEVDTMNFDQ